MKIYQAAAPATDSRTTWFDSFTRMGKKAVSVAASLFSSIEAKYSPALERAISQIHRAPIKLDCWKIMTYDGAELESIEFSPSEYWGKNSEPQHYVIFFLDGERRLEHQLQTLADDALDLECTVIGFNYRSIGEPQNLSRCYEAYKVDGIAVVKRLLDQGILPENITLYGYLSGGMIATLVAAYFHEQGRPVNLFNDRSLSEGNLETNSIIQSSTYADWEVVSSLHFSDPTIPAQEALQIIPDEKKGGMYLVTDMALPPKPEGHFYPLFQMTRCQTTDPESRRNFYSRIKDSKTITGDEIVKNFLKRR